MRNLFLVVVFLVTLFWSGDTPARGFCPGQSGQEVEPIGFQRLVVSTTPVGLTLPPAVSFNQVALATATVEAQPLRYRADGVAPDTNTGNVLNATDSIVICRRSLRVIQFIRDGTIDAILNVHFWGI